MAKEKYINVVYDINYSKPTYGFKGKQHTIESKNKISKSLKKYYSKGGGVAYVQEIIWLSTKDSWHTN